MEEKPVARSVPIAKKRLGLRVKMMFGSLRYYARKPFQGVLPSMFSVGALWTVCYWAGMTYFLPDHPLNNHEFRKQRERGDLDPVLAMKADKYFAYGQDRFMNSTEFGIKPTY